MKARPAEEIARSINTQSMWCVYSAHGGGGGMAVPVYADQCSQNVTLTGEGEMIRETRMPNYVEGEEYKEIKFRTTITVVTEVVPVD